MVTPGSKVDISEITAWSDGLAAQARELYERSFPPAERHDFARIRQIPEEPDEPRSRRIIAATDGSDLLGLSIFRRLAEASLGYLWYLCVDEASRGSGIGVRLYRATLDALRADAARAGHPLKGLIFEVERLDSELHPIYGDPTRRVKFYERLGARLILGYDYWQPPIPPHGPVPLQLMFHPLDLKPPECTEAQLARIITDFLRYGQGVEDAEVEAEGLRLG